MMKWFIGVLLPFFCITASYADENAYTLSLKVHSPFDAPVYVAAYTDKQSFLDLDKVALKVSFPANSKGIYIISGLSKGTYALAVFQDINENGELDTSLFGVPKEPYGFSNNATARLGAPSYDTCSFSVSGDKSMEILLR